MTRRRVLFLCTANSARSQMAEGLAHHLAPGALEVRSAGSASSAVHPLAVEVMAERGIDISAQRSESLDRYLGESFDEVITVCDRAAADCPVFPGPARRRHWSIADPAEAGGDVEARRAAFRAARDELEARVRDWLGD